MNILQIADHDKDRAGTEDGRFLHDQILNSLKRTQNNHTLAGKVEMHDVP